MAIKACISSWGYRKWFTEKKCDFLSFLDECKRQGADGFEIFPWHIDRTRFEDEIRGIAAKARDLKLEVSSLIVGNDFAEPPIAKRAEHVDWMVRSIKVAAEVGIARLNVFTGYHKPGQDPEMETARVIDCFREIAPLAEEKGIWLCLENHSSVHPDIDGLLWMMQKIGSRMVVPNPDVSNVCPNYTERSEKERDIIYTSLEKFAPGAKNVHLKVRDFTAAGEHAFLDIPRIAAILKQNAYSGSVVLEYHGTDDPVEPVAKGLAMVRRHFA
jgi:sugar phosphate isomerase/epimerase